MQKYMRIQGREISFKTKKPAGLFALCWRRIRDGIFSAEDEAEFRELDKWFRKELPIPPFYDENEKKYLDAGKPLPVTWFKTDCPPKMKEWFDKVLTSNWAFKDAYHLENKKIGLCISCGSEEAAYTSSGRHHRKVEDYLANVLHAFEMCRVDYVGSYITYGINDTEIVTADVIGQRAREYIDWLKSIS